MNATAARRGSSWSTRLLIAAVLILAGAAAATWALARYQPAARVLGVVPPPATPAARVQPVVLAPQGTGAAPATIGDPRLSELEQRLARVENVTQRAAGSAGRADALVIAFAARRAIDRGVALGYLENLLVQRFGPQHQSAVATIITAAHQPVELATLVAEYDTLGPELRRGGPEDSWWTNFKRELGTLIEVHRADQPSTNPDAGYRRARQRLAAGEVDQALAETMRLPGHARAADWIGKARRYIAVHRALDEIESAALLGRTNSGG